MVGIQPEARHMAVSMPVKKKVIRMPFTVLMPDRHITVSALTEKPFTLPNVKNSISPASKPRTIDLPVIIQPIRMIQKTINTSASIKISDP